MPLENIGRIINITKKGEKIKVDFSTSWKSILLSNDSFTDDFYYVGKEITKKEYDKIVASLDDEKYLNYAISITSKKAYSKKELIEKLKSKGAEKKTIERVVRKLIDYSLIDDKKFVEDYTYYHEQKLEGRIKIEKDLKEKGIAYALIKNLNFDYDNEINKATLLIEPLMIKHKNKSKLKQKEAIISSLIRKGYTYDIATICYEKEAKKYLNCDEEKLKKALFLLKSRGYEKNIIIKKLLAKGFSYNDILKVLKGE